MRKSIAMLGAVALLTIMPATPVLAESPIVIDEGACFGFIPTASGEFDPATIFGPGRIHVVTKGSWTTLTCHLDIPPNLIPKKVRRANGVECYTSLGLTNDSRMQATPGGRATATCRVRN